MEQMTAPMRPDEYIIMRGYEDTYWWYSGLRRLLTFALEKYIWPVETIAVLDAGCGTGGNLVHLKQILNRAKFFGMDVYQSAIDLTNSRNTGAALLEASVNQVPAKGNSFDVIICRVVLGLGGIEDLKVLLEFYRTLKPGGILLVNLPAFEFLRGAHDSAVRTSHRYTVDELRQKLNATGFAIRRITYWNALLFPLLFVWRKISALKKNPGNPRSDFRPLPVWINEVLKFLLRIEQIAISYVDVPFRTSVFAVAQKP